jgi:folate-binding protein YgfZ
LTPDDWLAADIAAGIPHVYAATSEAFVAQMLNLDLLDGIAFDKGCYTGQEVIARAHYRGKVKRRMQRFRTREPAKPNPGDSGTLADGRTFKVVAAVQLSDGRSEFLAVAPTTPSANIDDEAHAAHTTDAAPLNAEQLALPYSLPT